MRQTVEAKQGARRNGARTRVGACTLPRLALTLALLSACTTPGLERGGPRLGGRADAEEEPRGASPPAAMPATSISAGPRHSCALGNGEVYCWGRGSDGELGGITQGSAKPRKVDGLVGQAAAVVAGSGFSCALVEGGRMSCWGTIGGVKLATPTVLTWSVSEYNEPLVSRLAAHDEPCMVTRAGRAVCGIHASAGGPGGVTVEPWSLDNSGPARDLSIHGRRACWVGVGGDVGCVDEPAELAAFAPGASAIATGLDHVCVLAKSGRVHCRGANDRWQLGGPERSSAGGVDHDLRFDEAGVPGLPPAAAITAGAHHTCAIVQDGTVRCWGANDLGQCGSAPAASTRPVEPRGVGVVSEIHASEGHTCARRSAREVVCWGDGADGKLGGDPSERGCAGGDCGPVLVTLP